MDNRMMRMGVASVVVLAPVLWATAGESGQREKSRSSAGLSLDKPPIAMVNAREYGVVGNGAADDTETPQAALNAAEKKGPVCYLPAGRYRIDGSLVVPAGVTLWGASGGVPHSEHPIGTVLLAYGGKGRADGERLRVHGRREEADRAEEGSEGSDNYGLSAPRREWHRE